MNLKLYIAGKITGDPEYKQKFKVAEEKYRAEGYIVLNPSWMPQGLQDADYMRMCLAMIDAADIVAFLPDYRHSRGARLEAMYCDYIGKRTIGRRPGGADGA